MGVADQRLGHNAKFDMKLMMNSMYGRFGVPDNISFGKSCAGILKEKYEVEKSNQLQIRNANNGFVVSVNEAKHERKQVGDSVVAIIVIPYGEHVFATASEMNKFITAYYKK